MELQIKVDDQRNLPIGTIKVNAVSNIIIEGYTVSHEYARNLRDALTVALQAAEREE